MAEKLSNGSGDIEFGGEKDPLSERLWLSISNIETIITSKQPGEAKAPADRVVRTHVTDPMSGTHMVNSFGYRYHSNGNLIPYVSSSSIIIKDREQVQYRSTFEQDEDDTATVYHDNSNDGPDAMIVSSNETVLSNMVDLMQKFEDSVARGQLGIDYEIE